MSLLMNLLLKPPPHHAPPVPTPASGAEPVAMAAAAGIMVVMTVVMLVFAALMIASMWKVFAKAGQPGWMALVPILNVLVLGKIAGKPGWWLFVPFLNIYAAFVIPIELAKAFGQGAGFGLGLIFLPFLFYPMLAFGSAAYAGVPGQAPPGGMARAY